MIKIRYSENEDVEIKGSTLEFMELRQVFQSIATKKLSHIIFNVEEDFDPSPYSMVLSELKCVLATENCIQPKDGKLIISGTAEFYNSLSGSIPVEVDDPVSGMNYHVHYDWVSFDQYLGVNAIGIIFSVNCNADSARLNVAE